MEILPLEEESGLFVVGVGQVNMIPSSQVWRVSSVHSGGPGLGK